MKRIVLRTLLLAVSVGVLRSATSAQGTRLVNAFPQLSFFKPVFLSHCGDTRLFVVQQDGFIKVFRNDSLAASASTFLDLSTTISSHSGEEGLLGLAFHPNYKHNGYFYVSYTRSQQSGAKFQVVIARYTVSQGDSNRADPSSETILLVNDKPADHGEVQKNHNGGMLAFGPDGFLYVGTGDGGSGNDPWNNAQDRSVLLGKILRIDVDHGSPYAIPPDNPYAGNTNGWKEEIWAYGLRNPWRFSFDPSGGALWAGDVGQGAREEVDLIVKGGNYGWRTMEGSICRPGGGSCDSTGLIQPLAEYDHSMGEAVVGGYVYHGRARPDLEGMYLYADWFSGRLWMLQAHGTAPRSDSLLSLTGRSISSFGTDANNEVYLLGWDTGTIMRFAGGPVIPPVTPSQPPPSSLMAATPNPSTGVATIDYTLTLGGQVTLEVYDVLGRVVSTLVDQPMDPGQHTATLNTMALASGVYFVRLATPETTLVKRLVIVR